MKTTQLTDHLTQLNRFRFVLRALEPTLLGVGHGPAVQQPGSAMDAAIAKGDRAARA